MIARAPLTTRNEAFGFYGTMICAGQDAAAAWAFAAAENEAATSCSAEGVCGFLDSTHGRHFADEVAIQMAGGLPLPAAILGAIATHQGWQITRQMSRDYGIPKGLPYLTGWVAYFEIVDEMKG